MKKGWFVFELAAFADMGIGGGKSNLDEIEILKLEPNSKYGS
jgi:hypothetical protein